MPSATYPAAEWLGTCITQLDAYLGREAGLLELGNI